MAKKKTTERAHALRSPSAGQMWLNCAPWVEFKRQAEAGLIEVPEQDLTAANRGTRLHDVMETLLRKLTKDPTIDPEKLLRAPLVKGLDDHDGIMVATAFRAAVEQLHTLGWPDSASVGLEVPLSLTHEPGQKGHVDFVVVTETTLASYDFKFGRGEVNADSIQNRVYAANMLHAMAQKGRHFEEIVLGIIQPELEESAVVEVTTPEALNRFRHYVEETVKRQDEGLDRRYASDPATCTWCPYKTYQQEGRTMACPANQRMMLEVLDVSAEVVDGEADLVSIERLYRSKKMIKNALDQARTLILEDEGAFPNWIRGQRRNPRAWDLDKVDESEIAHELRKEFDLNNPYQLKTPAQIMKDLSPEADLAKFLRPQTFANTLRLKKK